VREQKLASNLNHLNNQLRFAKAAISGQAARIHDQERVIAAQEYALKLHAEKVGTSDRVELMGGTVALTKFEAKGVEVSLAAVFRKLEGLFRKLKRT
jgi:hypothetical protein